MSAQADCGKEPFVIAFRPVRTITDLGVCLKAPFEGLHERINLLNLAAEIDFAKGTKDREWAVQIECGLLLDGGASRSRQ